MESSNGSNEASQIELLANTLKTNTLWKSNVSANLTLLRQDPTAVLSQISNVDINNNISTECTLSKALAAAKRCVYELLLIQNSLATMSSSTQGQGSTTFSARNPALARMSEIIYIESRYGFGLAHNLYKTAIGIYIAEDFIRNLNPKLLNFQSPIESIIKIPSISTHEGVLSKIKKLPSSILFQSVDDFEKSYADERKLKQVLNTLLNAFEDFRDCSIEANGVFHTMLYVDQEKTLTLKKFFSTLNSMERSDIIMELQGLRQNLDLIAILFEKLSWSSYVTFRLSGRQDENREDNGSQEVNSEVTEIADTPKKSKKIKSTKATKGTKVSTKARKK